jgi:acetyltransferase-like isoleucine patch superfamily enzyme
MNLIRRYFEVLNLVMGIISHLFGALIVGLALLPSYYLVRFTWAYVSRAPDRFVNALVFCLSLGLASFLFGNMLLLVIVLFRTVLPIKNKEVSGEFRGLPVHLLRMAAQNFLVNLAQHSFLPMLRGTPLIIWFYRGMGMKVGKDTLITTTRIMDCDMIEIGDGCVIGGGAAISAHTGEKGRGVLRPVKLGNRVTIGADTMVLPGTVIEDNVIVGANSVVPKDSHLEGNAIYAGIPVKKIKSMDE